MKKYTIENLNKDAGAIQKKYVSELKAAEVRLKLIEAKITDEIEVCREKYYDDYLRDKNNNPIRINDKFEWEEKVFLVIDRYNQALIDFIDNPRLVCVRQLGKDKWTKSKYLFYKSDVGEVSRIEADKNILLKENKFNQG